MTRRRCYSEDYESQSSECSSDEGCKKEKKCGYCRSCESCEKHCKCTKPCKKCARLKEKRNKSKSESDYNVSDGKNKCDQKSGQCIVIKIN